MTDMISSGVSALLAYSQALNTVSNNIANANTVGYSRQQATLQANVLGGVQVSGIQRFTDALLVSLGADPTFSMTIPAKVQTYLMAGRPILAMLDGEGAAVVRDAAAGYAVAAGDAAGLADAVRQMMSASPVERQAMAERGKAYAAREFDRAGLITRLEEIVADLGRQK